MKPAHSNSMPLAEAYASVCDRFGETQGRQALLRALIEGEIPSFGRRASLGCPNDRRGRIEGLPAPVWGFASIEWQENSIRFALSGVDDPQVLSWQLYRPVTEATEPVSVQDDMIYVEIEVSRTNFEEWANPETDLARSRNRGKPGPKVPKRRDDESKRRIATGDYPGAPNKNVPWDRFADEIRDACAGWSDRHDRRTARGFSDRAIERAVSRLTPSR
jgi:hypothetical protein